MNAKAIPFLLAFSLAACGGAGTLPGSRTAQGITNATPSPAPIPSPSPAPPYAHPIRFAADVLPVDEPDANANAAPPRLLSVTPASSFSSRISVSRTTPTTLTASEGVMGSITATESSPACVTILGSSFANGEARVNIIAASNAPAGCLGVVRIITGQKAGLAYVVVP